MKVIFFDGYCGLCNGFIDFMMMVDKKNTFKFSPLQGEYAKAHLPAQDIEDLKSVVLLIEGKTYRKAPAVLKALNELGGIWKLSSAFNLLPDGLLTKAYDFTAANRYKIFGKKETCRLPTPEERERFLP
jgi:predicted DCC family thiol-disulfide oxidoreductase YuxK